ncbi:MAG TPA: glycoside hydrolase family 3 N-terminal domain-containing protein, partial [Actinomycetota bacterium]|nr:glycoside hydrolase family 3 N-terminal domain-containing protein [Actinomycetota bacterium]
MGSLQRLADACLLPAFEGTTAPDWVRRRVAEGLGGVVLYARNVASPAQVERLTAALRAERPALLVATDEEGGDVTRLEAATGSSYPGNLALGAAGDPALTRAVGAALGADLAAAGISLDFAPVADVNSNPANPVIGVRSFGADPGRVAAHVVAMVEGLQGAGVAACAKHFPGHGDTAVDSHLELPTAGGDAATLAGALVPFRAAVAAGVRCVMTAHVRVPAYGEDPATLDRRVLTGLLREELGFDGLVVTDALEMRAIAGTVGFGEGGVRALTAGADALCIGGGHTGEGTVDLLRDAVVDAVRAGRLAEERLAEAAARVARVGTWAAGFRAEPGAGPGAGPPAGRPGPRRGDPEAGLDAARRAVRAEGSVRVGTGAVVVELRPGASIAVGNVPWGVGDLLASRDPTVEVIRCAEGGRVEGHPPDAAALAARAAGRPLVLVVRDL